MQHVFHDGQRWSNAEADQLAIVAYDVRWPSLFEQEAALIRSQLGESFAYSIEHIGSTAVPGLAAKPTIDISLVLPDRNRWPSLVEPLAVLGYVHWAENPNKTKMFFVKGMSPFGSGRTHHVHVHGPEGAQAAIRFRDYLISHPDQAARYERLKRQLAERFPTDRDAYTNAKAQVVAEVLEKIRASPGDAF